MGLRLKRSLGPATALQPGEWTDQTASGNPAVCCPNVSCAAINELSDPPHNVFGDGIVSGVWGCPNEACSFLDFLTLGSWHEDVAR